VTSPLLVDHAYPPSPSCWADLAAAGAPWHGAILKASEGLRPHRHLEPHWAAIRDAGGARYGVDFFRGGYHFLRLDCPGAAQADHYLDTIERAGGWDVGDLWPIVDIEEGSGNDAIVSRRGAGVVSDVAHAFVERVRQRTGREVVLYFGGWLRSLGLRSTLGCRYGWIAAYTPTLPAAWWRDLGFVELWAWQYAGHAGNMLAELEGYPHTTPVGDADISALTLPGGIERMRSLLWAERPV